MNGKLWWKHQGYCCGNLKNKTNKKYSFPIEAWMKLPIFSWHYIYQIYFIELNNIIYWSKFHQCLFPRTICHHRQKMGWRWTNAKMTSSNGNIFCVTGVTGPRWIPLTKASDAGLWCFLWCTPEQTGEETLEMPVILDAMALIMTLPLWPSHYWTNDKAPKRRHMNVVEFQITGDSTERSG